RLRVGRQPGAGRDADIQVTFNVVAPWGCRTRPPLGASRSLVQEEDDTDQDPCETIPDFHRRRDALLRDLQVYFCGRSQSPTRLPVSLTVMLPCEEANLSAPV